MSEEAQEKFNQYMKFARTAIYGMHPFYAGLMGHIKVSMRKGVGAEHETAFTDGKNVVFYDTILDKISKNEFAGILMHEVMHVALQHVPRMKQQAFNPQIWNFATDYYINDIIKQSIDQSRDNTTPLITLPKWVLHEVKYRDMSSDAIYQQLMKDVQEMHQQCTCGSKNESGQGEDGTDQQDGSGEGTPESGDGNGSGSCPVHGNTAHGQNGPSGFTMGGDLQQESIDPAEFDKLAEDWKYRIAEAAQQAQMRGQGNMPGGLARYIEEVLHPKVSWRTLLAEFVQSFPHDYFFHPEDRRFGDFEFIIPTLSGETVEIVVAVDTSGSFSQEQLRDSLSETYGMMAAIDHMRMTVVPCDARVHEVTEVQNRTDLERVTFGGGGGTDFRPVFDWIEENKPDTKALIYFTDGYGTFPEHPPGYKVVWVMMDSPVEPPFGHLLEYDSNS